MYSKSNISPEMELFFFQAWVSVILSTADEEKSH